MLFLVYSTTAIVLSNSQNPALLIGFLNGATLALLMYAFANSSGAHFNPNITLATICTGHTPIVRGIMYIIAQTVAAIIAATFIISCDITGTVIWGTCSKGNLNFFQALLWTNIFMTIPLLVIAYGSAFDRGQAALYGPLFVPMAIAFMLMVIIIVSGGASATSGFEWGGNPAFCAGGAVDVPSNSDVSQGAGLAYLT